MELYNSLCIIFPVMCHFYFLLIKVGITFFYYYYSLMFTMMQRSRDNHMVVVFSRMLTLTSAVLRSPSPFLPV